MASAVQVAVQKILGVFNAQNGTLVGFTTSGEMPYQSVLGSAAICSTLANLRLTPHSQSQYAFVTGATTAGDGLGGNYFYNANDNSSGAWLLGSIAGGVLNVSQLYNGTIAIGQSISRGDTGAVIGTIASGSGTTWTLSGFAGSIQGPLIFTCDNNSSYVVAIDGGRWDIVSTLAAIPQNLLPAATDTYNLGASGLEWLNVYGKNGIFSTLAVTTVSSSLVPTTDNSETLGTSSDAWAQLYLGANHTPVLGTNGAIGYWPQITAESGVTVVNPQYYYGNVMRYGATGNGSTDDKAAFAAANTVGYPIIIPPGTYRIASALSLSVNCAFAQGAVLKPDGSVTVTINGIIYAGNWQIFNLSNSGALIRGVFSGTDGCVLFQWWGAACNGSSSGAAGTDDCVPVQQCFDALAAAGTGNVRLLVGNYVTLTAKNVLITGTLNSGIGTYVPKIIGAGNDCCGFNYPNMPYTEASPNTSLYNTFGALVVQTAQGLPGNTMKDFIQDVAMNGNVGTGSNGTWALEVRHSNMLSPRNVAFNANQGGIILHNYNSGTWTEYFQAYRCFFGYNCLTSLRYKVTSGNNSFKKSGLVECLLTNYGAGNPSGDNTAHYSVIVDSGATPYQAPLTISAAGDGTHAFTIIENNCASGFVSFYGDISTETGRNLCTIASGSATITPIVGRWIDFETPNSPGTAVFSEHLGYASGTLLFIEGKTSNYISAMAVGANTLTSRFIQAFHAGYIREITLELYAANYLYRYVLHVGGGNSTPAVISTLASTNGAGYGAPTFSTDSNGQLIVTNSSWPASTVKAWWTEKILNATNINVTTDYMPL